MVTEFEQVIDEIKEDYRNYEGSKKEKIIRAAEILIKNKWPPEKVATKLKEELYGYVTGAYIRQVLDPELKRQYAKPEEQKQVINADGTLAEPETESESESNPKLTKAEQRQQYSEQYDKNKYKISDKAIKEVNSSSGGRRNTQTTQEEREREIEETGPEPVNTTVILSPVHFQKISDLMKQDKNIYMDYNEDTYMITKLWIKNEE